MPRFSYEDADKYGSKGGRGAYFQLKNDGDTARVHLLGNSMNDFPGYAVHQVEVGDRKVYVNCLREVGDPIDVCPFCAEGKNDPDLSKVIVKVFIPLYNIDADEVQVWERGKTFFRDLSSYISHTPNASSVVTEIERRGEKNDTNTTYGLYALKDEDDGFDIKNVEDEISNILDGKVLDKDADEMDYYLRRGEFPEGKSKNAETKRRSDTRDEDRSERRADRDRRTPSRRREEDDY